MMGDMDEGAWLRFPWQFGDIEDSNQLLRVGLKIDKNPIHIRPMQFCEIL